MNYSFLLDQYEKIYQFSCVPTYEKSDPLDTLQGAYTACSSNTECIGIFLDDCDIVDKAELCTNTIYNFMYFKLIETNNAKSPKSCMYKKKDAYGKFLLRFRSFTNNICSSRNRKNHQSYIL